MAEGGGTSYEAVPYDSVAFFDIQPDRMAVAATLFGLRPPPVADARVLELGCAGGGNLVPLAVAAPGARFVGVDLSPRQVADGRVLVDRLGLTNVALHAMDLAEIPADFGTFDYILCHGVYSWVPPAVQARILAICRDHLAPEGVALVSHNCLPGWHGRGVVRDLMVYRARGRDDPAERIARARSGVDLVAAALPDREAPYGRGFAEEAARVRREADSYLLHEHLEAVNEPIHLYEFVERAEVAGLQYLGDARPRTLADNQPPAIAAALDRLGGGFLEREQHLDFLRNRTFRRSILCHAGVDLTRPARPEAVRGLRASALAGPVSQRTDIHSEAVEEFRSPDGTASATSTNPLTKALLLTLFERWPRSVPFDEVARLVHGRLDRPAGPTPVAFDRRPEALAEALLQCFVGGVVDLHAFEPPLAAEIAERPKASPLARLQAETSPRVTNLRHRVVELGPFDRLVLGLLDGDRDGFALIDGLAEAVADGRFPLVQDGQPVTDGFKVRQILGRSVDPSLRRLASSALLLG